VSSEKTGPAGGGSSSGPEAAGTWSFLEAEPNHPHEASFLACHGGLYGLPEASLAGALLVARRGDEVVPRGGEVARRGGDVERGGGARAVTGDAAVAGGGG